MQCKNVDRGKRRKQNEGGYSPWLVLRQLFCPCLLPQSNTISIVVSHNYNQQIESASVQSRVDEQSREQDRYDVNLRGEIYFKRKKSKQRISEEVRESSVDRGETLLRPLTHDDIDNPFGLQIELNRMRSREEMHWSVCNLTENYLIPVGVQDYQLLVKVSPVTIKPNSACFKKDITKFSRKDKKDRFSHYQFDRCWNERYLYFDKFDEGIKISEDSWDSLPEQALCEYIASKCKGARVIVDGFAGVGGVAIKMAGINSCVRVIANEASREKLSFLLNNAAIYEVEQYLQLRNQQFVKLQRVSADVVFVQPALAQCQVGGFKNLGVGDFAPNLEEVVEKAMRMAGNVMLLLPPETRIDQVCGVLNKWGGRLGWMREFCSVKVEKIYCKMQVKFILVCAGRLVQTEVKLNDELEYIYTRLKGWNDKYFKYKKIVKRIREDHGMLTLLNAVKLSERRRREAFMKEPTAAGEQGTISYFYEIILERKLIDPERLGRIKQEQEETYDKKESGVSWGVQELSQQTATLMEEEKMQENPDNVREAELTSSEYSYMSYFQSLGKGSREEQSRKQSNGVQKSSVQGVIIQRNGSSRKEDHEEVQEEYVEEQAQGEEGNNRVSVNLMARGSELNNSKRELVSRRCFEDM